MDEFQKVTITRDELKRLKRHLFGDAPYIDRLSLAFVMRLKTDPLTRPDSLLILREIDSLEGLRPGSTTKAAAPFSHPPLNRFWHKHFSSPRHLFRNVGEEWGLVRRSNKKLTILINEVARSHGDKPDQWPGVLAHRIWLEGYQVRSQQRRRTGDWIVFGKHEGRNYYLDLATHREGEKQNVEKLFEKIKQGCAAEFPFIFE
jgi:hypothetical protein